MRRRRKPGGRPRRRPDKLHADKSYDHRFCRADCRRRGITPRIARRGIEDSRRLGRHRWKVERTLAWLGRYRRLSKDYEKLTETSAAAVQVSAVQQMLRRLRRKQRQERFHYKRPRKKAA